jgi:hypothetical protein
MRGGLRRALLPAAGLLALGALRSGVPAWLPPCPFQLLTGLSCPGCGSLRALHELMHGRLAAALDLNALTVLLLPLLGAAMADEIGLLARGRALGRLLYRRELALALLGLVTAFGVLRNLGVFPFARLAP